MKKIICVLLLSGAILEFGGCKPMKKAPKSIEGKEGIFAVINTEKGDIVIELYYKDVPLTVTNFVGLAEGTLSATKGKPFYDGLKFHRVIPNFMIQGGDPLGNGTGGPGYKFSDEILEKYKFSKPGILAMANAGPGTNGSQFFITHVETPWLNGKHTIFGYVVSQKDQKVVDSIEQGDKIVSIKIFRQGEEAKKFSATQEDFNLLSKKVLEDFENAKKKIFENAIKNCQKTSDGIYYKITTEGSGVECGSGKNVTVEYKGYLLDGTIFDASSFFEERGHAPLDFMTGAGQMISGFDIMVSRMKEGEIRTIILPPELHYGPNGYGPIPPNSYIAFDIKLVKIK